MLDCSKKQNKLDEAETLYKRALKGTEEMLGRKHSDTLTTVNNLARLFKKQDKLDLAELLYKRALEGQEEMLGRKHSDTLNTLYLLAYMLKKQDRISEVNELKMKYEIKMYPWER